MPLFWASTCCSSASTGGNATQCSTDSRISVEAQVQRRTFREAFVQAAAKAAGPCGELLKMNSAPEGAISFIRNTRRCMVLYSPACPAECRPSPKTGMAEEALLVVCILLEAKLQAVLSPGAVQHQCQGRRGWPCPARRCHAMLGKPPQTYSACFSSPDCCVRLRSCRVFVWGSPHPARAHGRGSGVPSNGRRA